MLKNLDSDSIDVNDNQSNDLRLKTPTEFFDLDGANVQYAGQVSDALFHLILKFKLFKTSIIVSEESWRCECRCLDWNQTVEKQEFEHYIWVVFLIWQME